jgi:hypothetical protein
MIIITFWITLKLLQLVYCITVHSGNAVIFLQLQIEYGRFHCRYMHYTPAFFYSGRDAGLYLRRRLSVVLLMRLLARCGSALCTHKEHSDGVGVECTASVFRFTRTLLSNLYRAFIYCYGRFYLLYLP